VDANLVQGRIGHQQLVVVDVEARESGLIRRTGRPGDRQLLVDHQPFADK